MLTAESSQPSERCSCPHVTEEQTEAQRGALFASIHMVGRPELSAQCGLGPEVSQRPHRVSPSAYPPWEETGS